MTRIIPVIDVLRGRAVHARAGRRDDYRPIRSALRRGSDPVALAAAVRDALGLRELYLADLDAIAGGAPGLGLCRRLAGLGLDVWADAGVVDGSTAPALVEAGVSRVVVGLETATGPVALGRALDLVGPGRLAFSLDLVGGLPRVAPGADWGSADPAGIAGRALAMGVGTVLLIDLARVGLGEGPGTLGLLERLAADHPGVEWVVGGGVAGPDDLRAIGRAGGSAALVASAIHDGRIGADRGPGP